MTTRSKNPTVSDVAASRGASDKASSKAVKIGSINLEDGQNSKTGKLGQERMSVEKIDKLANDVAIVHAGILYLWVAGRPQHWKLPVGCKADARLYGCTMCQHYVDHMRQTKKSLRGSKWSRHEVAISQPSGVRNHERCPMHTKAVEFFFQTQLQIKVQVKVLGSESGSPDVRVLEFNGLVPKVEDYLKVHVATMTLESNGSYKMQRELDFPGEHLSGVAAKCAKMRWAMSEEERSDNRTSCAVAWEVSLSADEKGKANVVLFSATNSKVETVQGVFGLLTHLRVDKGHEPLGSEQRFHQKWVDGLEQLIQRFCQDGVCNLPTHKAGGVTDESVKANLKIALNTIALDGASGVQKAGRVFAGRNGLALVKRDLCHILNKHMEIVSQVEPTLVKMRHHLFKKDGAFLKELMYSERLQLKVASAQAVVIKEDAGVLQTLLLSYSHSSVRFAGETDSLFNLVLTYIACTLVNADEADDVRRKVPARAVSAATRDAIFLDITMSIFCWFMDGSHDIVELAGSLG